MVAKPLKHIVKAFAVHEGKYYPMTPRREVEDNALMYLGRAAEGQAASDDLEEWHASALTLLGDHTTDRRPHAMVDGSTGDLDGGRLIGEPWYAVFEHAQAGAEPGDLWVGRFFEQPSGLTQATTEGVFVVPDDLAPTEPDDRPILSSRQANRSVILQGRTAAGGNTLSSNQGGEAGLRLEW